jgi:hypothetical protein
MIFFDFLKGHIFDTDCPDLPVLNIQEGLYEKLNFFLSYEILLPSLIKVQSSFSLKNQINTRYFYSNFFLFCIIFQ